MNLTTLLAGFGVAVGSGGRAALVAAMLGSFHYTPYFKLAPQFSWLAAPPVLVVLWVLAALELAADLDPDLSELADVAGYLTKFAGGFIAVAAATGRVDSSLLELLASGLLGAGIATSVHWVKTRARRTTREIAAATHDAVDKLAGAGGAFAAAGITTSAILAPATLPWILGLVGVLGYAAWRAFRWVRGRLEQTVERALRAPAAPARTPEPRVGSGTSPPRNEEAGTS